MEPVSVARFTRMSVDRGLDVLVTTVIRILIPVFVGLRTIVTTYVISEISCGDGHISIAICLDQF